MGGCPGAGGCYNCETARCPAPPVPYPPGAAHLPSHHPSWTWWAGLGRQAYAYTPAPHVPTGGSTLPHFPIPPAPAPHGPTHPRSPHTHPLPPPPLFCLVQAALSILIFCCCSLYLSPGMPTLVAVAWPHPWVAVDPLDTGQGLLLQPTPTLHTHLTQPPLLHTPGRDPLGPPRYRWTLPPSWWTAVYNAMARRGRRGGTTTPLRTDGLGLRLRAVDGEQADRRQTRPTDGNAPTPGSPPPPPGCWLGPTAPAQTAPQFPHIYARTPTCPYSCLPAHIRPAPCPHLPHLVLCSW